MAIDLLIDTDDDDPHFIIGGGALNRGYWDDLSFLQGDSGVPIPFIGGGRDNNIMKPDDMPFTRTTRSFIGEGDNDSLKHDSTPYTGTTRSFIGGGVDNHIDMDGFGNDR